MISGLFYAVPFWTHQNGLRYFRIESILLSGNFIIIIHIIVVCWICKVVVPDGHRSDEGRTKKPRVHDHNIQFKKNDLKIIFVLLFSNFKFNKISCS